MDLIMDVDTILCKNEEDRKERLWLLSEHCKERAQHRFISFAEIKSCLEYGAKREADQGAWEYRFAGAIVIVDRNESIVLTVYPEPGYGIVLDKIPITRVMKHQHKGNLRSLEDKHRWTSHTVAVIDQSGSMRKTDIDKKVTRSDLTWLTLAMDVVRDGLKTGNRKPTDVLSVVTMKDNATVVIDRHPFDWFLFNRLVEIMRTEAPSSGGNYAPALKTAADLLMCNRSRNCARTLLFLSDGKPSDNLGRSRTSSSFAPTPAGRYQEWQAKMKSQLSPPIEELAASYGKRLNLCFYGIGPENSNDFSVLKYMADQAKEYECPVIYQTATLNAGALSSALRTMSNSTTDTITTISEFPKCFEYRDAIKMKKSEVGSPIATKNWEVFVQAKTTRGNRITKSTWVHGVGWETDRNTFFDASAIGIAWETRWFGEGRERLAKELREVGSDGKTFVGSPMVLKASITVSKSVNVDSKEFHKRFCKSQYKAAAFAFAFNKVGSKRSMSTPKIDFLPCWVYMVELGSGERKGYLAEPSLDVDKYRKFNDNQGKVFATPSVPSPRLGQIGLPNFIPDQPTIGRLETIAEETDFGSEGRASHEEERAKSSVFGDSLLQAFSCWTYKIYSKRKYLVCDLQGTFENEDDGPGVYRLTDPVIHTSDRARKELQEKYGRGSHKRFGRTDRGQEGINDFFRSHKCSELCRKLRGRRLRDQTQSPSSFVATVDEEYPMGAGYMTKEFGYLLK